MADQPPTQRCENCRFCQPRDVEKTENVRIVYQVSSLVCKRFPPTIGVSQSRESRTCYPLVLLHQWCGEWEPACPDTVEDAAVVIARQVIIGDKAAARGLVDKIKEWE